MINIVLIPLLQSGLVHSQIQSAQSMKLKKVYDAYTAIVFNKRVINC